MIWLNWLNIQLNWNGHWEWFWSYLLNARANVARISRRVVRIIYFGQASETNNNIKKRRRRWRTRWILLLLLIHSLSASCIWNLCEFDDRTDTPHLRSSQPSACGVCATSSSLIYAATTTISNGNRKVRTTKPIDSKVYSSWCSLWFASRSMAIWSVAVGFMWWNAHRITHTVYARSGREDIHHQPVRLHKIWWWERRSSHWPWLATVECSQYDDCQWNCCCVDHVYTSMSHRTLVGWIAAGLCGLKPSERYLRNYVSVHIMCVWYSVHGEILAARVWLHACDLANKVSDTPKMK